jgi:stress response protein YsnF
VTLPIEATVERTPDSYHWTIRLPVRREEVQIDKRTVVGERIVVHRVRVVDAARIDARLRRERLRVDTYDRDATEQPTPPRPHDTLAGTGMDQEPTA